MQREMESTLISLPSKDLTKTLRIDSFSSREFLTGTPSPKTLATTEWATETAGNKKKETSIYMTSKMPKIISQLKSHPFKRFSKMFISQSLIAKSMRTCTVDKTWLLSNSTQR